MVVHWNRHGFSESSGLVSLRDDRDAERIERIFGRYVEQLVLDGVAPDPEELCRGSPELLQPLAECIREYERLGKVLAPPEGLAPGRRLLHYRIVEKLGEGGMGEVYAAEDSKLGRRVALKVLPPGMADDPERLGRFRREAKAVAALNHPNIVTIYSVEESGGSPLPDHGAGGGEDPRSERISDRPGFSGGSWKLWPSPGRRHGSSPREGVTHRDLKPANIMVSAEERASEGWRRSQADVKILDFGLAKLHEVEPAWRKPTRQAASTTLRHPGTAIISGTVPYMSPEQVQGKPVDHSLRHLLPRDRAL